MWCNDNLPYCNMYLVCYNTKRNIDVTWWFSIFAQSNIKIQQFYLNKTIFPALAYEKLLYPAAVLPLRIFFGKICYIWQLVQLAVSSRNCCCLYCNAVYVWCVVFYNSCSNMLRQRCCSRTEKWIPTLSRGIDWFCSTVNLELICFSLCTFVWCLLHCSAEAPLPRYLNKFICAFLPVSLTSQGFHPDFSNELILMTVAPKGWSIEALCIVITLYYIWTLI